MALLIALTLLHGMVRIGPVTPVCRAETPCDRPAARVVVTFSRPGQRVRVTTDGRGHYRVRLAPGRWSVRANVGIRIAPMSFVVPRALAAARDFAIDTGIR